MPTVLLPWLQLVFTGVVSALVTAWATAWATAWRTKISETTARRIAFLETQIQKVYSPAYLLMMQGGSLYGLHRRYYQAWEKGKDLIIEAQRNNEEQTVSELLKDLSELHGILTDLTYLGASRFKEAIQLFNDNAYLVDPSDLLFVIRLYEGSCRYDVERSKDENNHVMNRLSQHVLQFVDGSDETIGPTTTEHIHEFAERLNAKNEELRKLRGLTITKGQKVTR